MVHEKVVLNESLTGLIGFAKRSGQISGGFENVKRVILRNKTAFILIDESLTQNSRQKIFALADKSKTKVYELSSATEKSSLWQISGYKIIGLHRGSLARGFLSKLKQES